MKNLITILCLCSFLFSDDCIEEVIERYDNGNKHIVLYFKMIDNEKIWIERKEYYEDGQLQIKSYGEGERLDSLFYYFENGNLKYESIKDSLGFSYQTLYSENGQKTQYQQYNKSGEIFYTIIYTKDGEIWYEVDKDKNIIFPDGKIIKHNQEQTD